MIIAIDPGKSGGIAWKDEVNVYAEKMPDTIKGIRDLLKKITEPYNPLGVSDDLLYCPPCVCYLEKVNSMPGQGVSSTWAFAENYGALKAILCCLNISLLTVSPKVWQRAIGATRPNTGKDATRAQKNAAVREGKHRIKEIVEARFPHLKVTLRTADALGILIYATKQEKRYDA